MSPSSFASEATDGFYRSTQERTEIESFWMGYSDGLDHATEHIAKLHAPKRIRQRYLEGYQNGFYDRKRHEMHTALDIALAVYMGTSRRALDLLAGVRWSNYTRTG